ncbi:protease, partial [bacterium]|nr:protease [bacterium]
MLQKDTGFPHLPLPLKIRDRARLHGGGKPPDQEKRNKENRQVHAQNLTHSARGIVETWTGRRLSRDRERLPTLPQGVPVLLQVEPDTDLEFLRSSFKFEVVSEQEDGFVIVSSEDLDLTAFLQKVDDFTREKWGAGTTAKIYDLHDDLRRFDRILSDSLREKWPTIADDKIYVFDIGVECLGTTSFSELEDRKKDETAPQYQARRLRWEARREKAYQAWDEIKIKREEEVESFVSAYKGEILDVVDNVKFGRADLSDSFTVRIKMSGRGMKDLILNHPYIFEVVEPDEFAFHNPLPTISSTETLDLKILPPDATASRVCVIDSGIQEEHKSLKPAIDSELSRCFILGKSPT